MSCNGTLALTVAAAAATTIVAVQYLLYTKRARQQREVSDVPSSLPTARGTLLESYLFKTLLKLTGQASRSACGGVAKPLAPESCADNVDSLQKDAACCSQSGDDATGQHVSTSLLAESTAASSLEVVGADCDAIDDSSRQLPFDTHSSCKEGLNQHPPAPAMKSAECSPEDPGDQKQSSSESLEHEAASGERATSIHSTERASDTAPSNTQPDAVLIDTSGKASSNSQPDAALENRSSASMASQKDPAFHANELHAARIFPDGTGTLVACPRPSLTSLAQHLPTLVEDSESETQPGPVSSAESQHNTSRESTTRETRLTLSSQPTVLHEKLASSVDFLPVEMREHKSPRTSLDLTQPATKRESPTRTTSSSVHEPSNPLEPRIEFSVVLGPSKGTVFTTTDTRSKVHIGRLSQCQLTVNDNEVSGSHCVVVYSGSEHCWKLADVGSLNGTQLNGKLVSKENRRPGDLHTLQNENLVKLGTATEIKIKCYIPPRVPRNDIGEHHRRHLFRNKIDFAPLRLEGCIVTQTGREHKRKASPSEDLVYFEAPFRQFHQAGLFCVFDGHNGRQAAELAKQLIPEEIMSNVNGATSLLGQGTRQEALETAFLAADARLSADEGCTATAVVAERAEDGTVLLQIANVGDSAAVLVDPESDSPCMKLTEDHRVVNPVEKERLQKKGFKGTTRLFGLALSRSMGDKFLKDVDIGLIAKPYVSQMVTIKPEESGVLVVASDGLWDVVTPERATKLVRTALEEAPGSVDHISERLLMFAVEHQSHDDITVMVLKFNASKQQSIENEKAAS